MKLSWTARAYRNLANIIEYIRLDNPPAAKKLEDHIFNTVRNTLTSQPLLGKIGRVAGTREIVVHSSYILIYKVEKENINIISLRHTARIWPKKF